MNSHSSHTTNSRRRVKVYRERLNRQGVKRIEVRIPAQDVLLVHDIAGILRTGGDEAELLREQLRQAAGDNDNATGKDLIAFFRESPLKDAGINLERDPSASRTVTFE